MKRVHVSARNFLEDIRKGFTDQELMEKYGLSIRSLPKVKKALLSRGLASAEELGIDCALPRLSKKPLNANAFVKDFRTCPDDMFLMEKYSIGVEQLRKVYHALVEKGLLDEYEYHSRNNKAPQLAAAENLPPEDSTAVGLLEDLSGSLKDYFAIPASLLTKYRARSSNSHRASTYDSYQEPFRGICPNCGRPLGPDVETSCMYCGIVLARAEEKLQRGKIAIWF